MWGLTSGAWSLPLTAAPATPIRPRSSTSVGMPGGRLRHRHIRLPAGIAIIRHHRPPMARAITGIMSGTITGTMTGRAIAVKIAVNRTHFPVIAGLPAKGPSSPVYGTLFSGLFPFPQCAMHHLPSRTPCPWRQHPHGHALLFSPGTRPCSHPFLTVRRKGAAPPFFGDCLLKGGCGKLAHLLQLDGRCWQALTT